MIRRMYATMAGESSATAACGRGAPPLHPFLRRACNMSYLITFLGLILGGIILTPLLKIEWEHEASC